MSSETALKTRNQGKTQHVYKMDALTDLPEGESSCDIMRPRRLSGKSSSYGGALFGDKVIVGLIQTDGQEVSVALRHGQAKTLQAAGDIHFDHNGQRHPVTLRTLLPYIDAMTRTREARLVFDAAPAAPGAAGRLVWQGRQRLLPPEFLMRRDGRIGVFVLDGEQARFHPLPDAQDGRPAAVDFAPDTRLIADGRQRLNDGDTVHLSETSG